MGGAGDSRHPLPVGSPASSMDDCFRRLPWLQRHAWTRPASVIPGPLLMASGSLATVDASWLGRDRAVGGRSRSTNGENGCNGTDSSSEEPRLSMSLWPTGGPRPSLTPRRLSVRRTAGSLNRNVLWTPAQPHCDTHLVENLHLSTLFQRCLLYKYFRFRGLFPIAVGWRNGVETLSSISMWWKTHISVGILTTSSILSDIQVLWPQCYSSCPSSSKVFEHCILDRYCKFFVTSDNQFGFKKKSGCRYALYTCLLYTSDAADE